MTDKLKHVIEFCSERNPVVRDGLSRPDETLLEHVEKQARKVLRNKGTQPYRDPSDYYERLHAYAAELTDEDTARRVREAAELRAVCTADHHGAPYYAPSFQGDLLFASLLSLLGYKGDVVPVLCAGQVELENASYARGVCSYACREEKRLFPIFPAKESVRLASYTSPFDRELLERFRNRFIKNESPSALTRILQDILQNDYETDSVLTKTRFSEQMTVVGASLTGRLYRDKGPRFLYLEMEALLFPLLKKELSEEDSLLSKLLFDPEVRKLLVEESFPDGTSAADLLFKGADEKGRKFHLWISEKGTLKGKDWRKQEVEYPADRDSLLTLLEDGRIFPGVFTLALLLFFERGVTWMGGNFQPIYLPLWQAGLLSILKKAGLSDAARCIESYDCTGYISGPVFALWRGDGYMAPAGPLEFLMAKPSYEQLQEQIRRTTCRDAQIMSVGETFLDLAARNEREPDWYPALTETLYELYGSGINGLPAVH